MAFVDGKLYVAGLSNEEFSSKLRSVSYPFNTVDGGTSVEIYHGNHGQFETRSPVYTFVPYKVKGETNLIAGYLCTPLVKFPVTGLRPGGKVMGTTIAELGNRNRPLDMIVYKKDGKEFLLMSNNSRGVMKISTDGFADAESITKPRDRQGRRGLRNDHGDEGRGAARPARRHQHHRARAHRRRRPQPRRRRPALRVNVRIESKGCRHDAFEERGPRDRALFLCGVRPAAARAGRAGAHRPQHRRGSRRPSMSSTCRRRSWSALARHRSRDAWTTVFRVAVAADQAADARRLPRSTAIASASRRCSRSIPAGSIT